MTEPLTDLLQLSAPDDRTVIDILVDRYKLGNFYTWLGENILLSLNPYEFYPRLYSSQYQISIAKATDFKTLPHVYSISEKCLRALIQSEENQSIIITGSSGSGKTEAAKFILQYLTNLSKMRRKKITFSDVETQIEKVIIESNPILEALGNARTIHNSNSSRFGKYLRLVYDYHNQILIGADLQIFLLEKPRTNFDASTLHSTFHIFRWFVASLTHDDYLRYGLANDYSLRSRADHEESLAKWIRLTQSLSILNVPVNELRHVLVTIVLLNTIQFVPDSKDLDLARICPNDIRKVCAVANILLGLSHENDAALVDNFKHQLLTKSVQAGFQNNRRTTCYATAFTVAEAREHRNCIVKALYNSLFNHIIELINEQLNYDKPVCMDEGKMLRELVSRIGGFFETGLFNQGLSLGGFYVQASPLQVEHDGVILLIARRGILDFFGFENFSSNSFEQFCINYANERLHHTFVQIALKSGYDEMKAEGVLPLGGINQNADDSTKFDRNDFVGNIPTNIETLDTLKYCTDILDEICQLNRAPRQLKSRQYSSHANTDLIDPREFDWLQRIQSKLSSHLKSHYSSTKTLKSSTDKYTSIPTLSTTTCFSVIYYAGCVNYSVCNFVSKNLDRMPHYFFNWLTDNAQCLSNTSIVHKIVTTCAQPHPPVCNSTPKTPNMAKPPLNEISSNVCLTTPNTCHKKSKVSSLLATSTFNSPKTSPMNSHRRRANTIFRNFKASLDDLLENISVQHLFFVQCICPARMMNEESKLSEFRMSIYNQFVNAGLMASINILQQVYSAKYTYKKFLQRYSLFWRLSSVDPPMSNLPNIQFALLNRWYLHLISLNRTPSKRTSSVLRRETGESVIQQQQQIVLILLSLGLNTHWADESGVIDSTKLTPRCQMLDDDWIRYLRNRKSAICQFGRQQIFLTADQHNRLELVRNLIRNQSARILQRFFKSIILNKQQAHASQSNSINDQYSPTSSVLNQSVIDNDDTAYNSHFQDGLKNNYQSVLTEKHDSISTISLQVHKSSYYISYRQIYFIPNYKDNVPILKNHTLNILIPYLQRPCLTRFYESIQPVQGIFDIFI